MTIVALPSASEFDWEAAGRALGASLDRLHAIAVLGSDPAQTARVALGIARQQAGRRRVAIGDLLDAEPLNSLIASDDPHGLADVFEYGVSIDKIAHEVAGSSNVYILPSGAFLSDQSAIMANRRWSRLAAGFREENGLLLVTVDVTTPGLENLVLQLDGAVLVGDLAPARLPVARVLGAVRGPHMPAAPAKPAEITRPRYVVRKPLSPWKVFGWIFGPLFVIGAAFAWWYLYQPFEHSVWAPMWLRGTNARGDTLHIVGVDSAGIAGTDTLLAFQLPTSRHLGLLTPLDSLARAPYGIALVTFNTEAGALLELQRNGATLRAGTFTPVLIRNTPWFRVLAGAYPDSAAAAALLDTLRARGTSDAGGGVIDRFPYALLVARDVPDTTVAQKVSGFQTRGLPVYALLQSDGTARLFAGAFRNPREAVPLYDKMKAAGIPTSLVYRTGRVY